VLRLVKISVTKFLVGTGVNVELLYDRVGRFATVMLDGRNVSRQSLYQADVFVTVNQGNCRLWTWTSGALAAGEHNVTVITQEMDPRVTKPPGWVDFRGFRYVPLLIIFQATAKRHSWIR
jgi:hypothetical protein